MDLPREIGQRIGVLGGTFDPVHNGHLALIEAAFAGLSLDSLVLVPAAVPPHKRDLAVTNLSHRLAMLSLAVSGRRGLYVSSLEAERPGPSFSVDTLFELRSHFAGDATLFFLVGVDAFLEIQSWKDYRQLPLLAELVVVERAGAHSSRMGDEVRSRFAGYIRDIEHGCWRGSDGLGVIRTLAMGPVDISSTQVRESIGRGHSVDSLLPVGVAEYISTQGLYRV